jgi:hypothetical protein
LEGKPEGKCHLEDVGGIHKKFILKRDGKRI